MLFAITCIDKPDHMDVRLSNRAAHIEYLKAKADMVRFAGPFTSDDGETMIGSMLVVEAADRAGAEDLAAGDPYARAGLFQSADIRAWKWLIGNPDA